MSDDISEVIRSLEDLAAPDYHAAFVKKLITMAMDRFVLHFWIYLVCIPDKLGHYWITSVPFMKVMDIVSLGSTGLGLYWMQLHVVLN